MTDCQCPSHVAQRAADAQIAGLAEKLFSELNEVERLRAGIRALSEHASLMAEKTISLARHQYAKEFHAGEAAAYAAMAEQLEALLPKEPA